MKEDPYKKPQPMNARIRYYWEEYQRPIKSLAIAIILIPICLWVHVVWLIVPAIFILRASRQAFYINRLLHNPIYLGWKLDCKIKQQTGQTIVPFDKHCNQLLDAIKLINSQPLSHSSFE